MGAQAPEFAEQPLAGQGGSPFIGRLLGAGSFPRESAVRGTNFISCFFSPNDKTKFI